MAYSYGSTDRSDLSGFNISSNEAVSTNSRVNHLLDKIRENIFSVTNNTSKLEQNIKLIGTERDSPALRHAIHPLQQSTNQQIQQIHQTFVSLSSIPQERRVKLLSDRLTRDFKTAVERYQQTQKKITDKIRQAPVPSSATSTRPTDTSGFLIDVSEETRDREDDEARLINEQKRRQLQTQQAEIETDLSQIREREDQIRQLESDILDVNDIFKDLSVLVKEQGEYVDRIEDNVTKAADNVDEGVVQLQRASAYQRKYRKKLCCLVTILLLVVAAIAIVIVIVVTNDNGKKKT